MLCFSSTEPPRVVIKPPDTDAPYGSTVLFTCVGFSEEDDEQTNIIWLKDSEVIDPISSENVSVYEGTITIEGVNFTRSILELCSVTFEDDGLYSCVANDSVGNGSAEFSLTVFTEGGSVYLLVVGMGL